MEQKKNNRYNLVSVSTFYLSTLIAISLVFLYTNLLNNERENIYNISFLSIGLVFYLSIFIMNVYIIFYPRKNLASFYILSIILSTVVYASLAAIYINLNTTRQGEASNLALIIFSSFMLLVVMIISGFKLFKKIRN